MMERRSSKQSVTDLDLPPGAEPKAETAHTGVAELSFRCEGWTVEGLCAFYEEWAGRARWVATEPRRAGPGGVSLGFARDGLHLTVHCYRSPKPWDPAPMLYFAIEEMSPG